MQETSETASLTCSKCSQSFGLNSRPADNSLRRRFRARRGGALSSEHSLRPQPRTTQACQQGASAVRRIWCSAEDVSEKTIAQCNRIQSYCDLALICCLAFHIFLCVIMHHKLEDWRDFMFISLATAAAQGWRGCGASQDLVCLWRLEESILSFVQAVLKRPSVRSQVRIVKGFIDWIQGLGFTKHIDLDLTGFQFCCGFNFVLRLSVCLS